MKTTQSIFSAPEDTDEDGVLGVSGDLDPEMLADAYMHGVFPWPVNDRQILWFCPPNRGVLTFDRVHVPRRLKRALPKYDFEFRISENFEDVIRACAEVPRPGQDGTWITPKIIRSYQEFRKLGFVHCFEAWHNGKLVGGMYGVSLGRLFCGESMFHKETDASKFVFLSALATLQKSGVELVDTQMITNMTAAFGAYEIPRREYLNRIQLLMGPPLTAELLRRNMTGPEVFF